MAATGKKSKKAKWVKANITDIIAEPTTIATTNSWADSVDEEPESFGYGTRTRGPVVLPSVSRAARGGMAVDDESIPKRPPFVAHISNLPYDVDESAITEMFTGLKITSLRLPREGDRLKGYGYVDFEDRDSLINAMNMPDLTISGRRIRIEVSTQDNDRRRMGNRNDRDREYDPERTMGDWRSGPRAMPEPTARPRTMDRENMRDRDRDSNTRDRDRDRERDSSADNRPGGWRDGDRPAAEPARAPYAGRDSFGRDRYADDRSRGGYGRDREGGERGERSGYGGRDGFRAATDRDSQGFGRDRDSRGFGSRGFGDRDRDRDPPREESKPRERPKLNLLPRTVPRDVEPAPGAAASAASGASAVSGASAGSGASAEEDKDKLPEKAPPKPVPAEKVFGAAKPVDTASKEREIEERLRKQEEEARRGTDDKERWGRRNDHSGERRGAPRRDDRRDDNRRDDRRDDRPRDSRSYNRDRRDYSKDDKDSRDYSKDEKDSRDYSKDDKDRRDYSKDKDSRDYSREDKSRRDHKDTRDHSADRQEESNPPPEHNGKARPSRSRDRHDSDEVERPLPKLKEQEKPNFVASNKFSFLEDADDGASE